MTAADARRWVQGFEAAARADNEAKRTPALDDAERPEVIERVIRKAGLETR